jgi:6-methylsalicylate decarboxylase
MRIDVHAHHLTEDMVRQARDFQGRQPRIAAAPGRDTTLDQRIEMMDRAGVDVQVLSVASNQPYGQDESRSVSLAREFNDLYKQVVDHYHGRYAAFGCVPLPHVEAAIAESGRCLDELGFAGITLGNSCLGKQYDDPQFEPFWAELNRRGTVVFFHPMFIGQAMCDAYNLDTLAGAPMEDTVTALRLVLSGLTKRHPKVKLIIPHLGGTIPYIWSRLKAPGLRDGLRELYYDNANLAPGMLCAACGMLPASHIMIGTDFPYVTPEGYGEYVTAVQTSGLPDDDITGILDRNAQEILHLPARR